MKVWLLTTGDGSDGSEWNVEGIYSTLELAEKAKKWYERRRYRPNATHYNYNANIEEWDVECGEER